MAKKGLLVWVVLAAWLAGCTASTVLTAARVAATGGNVAAVAESVARSRVLSYATNPYALKRDLDRLGSLLGALHDAAGEVWGDEEVVEPQPREYVKYTQNYLSRAMVDFDQGQVVVETIDPDNPLDSLKNAIVTTLLTPNDPRAVDLFTAQEVRLGDMPFLFGEVVDHEGENIRWAWRAEQYANWLIENGLQTRALETDDSRLVHYVTFNLIADHENIRAEKYKPFVEKYAAEFDISPNLIYAVIRIESNFNPFAVSRAPAFGLMQIVPSTAGLDVYRFLNDEDGLPSTDLLFDPESNIRYGTAYLHLLQNRYLEDILDPISLEYCTIAAYNGGTGSVWQAFGGSPSTAAVRINNLDPLSVYNRLVDQLPAAETRNYLVKVVAAKKEFIAF